MSKYLWYSGATDITGIALAEALRIESGKTKPRNANIIIGWGTKTDGNTDLGNTIVLNHPNAIRKNRNKLGALDIWAAARDLRDNIAVYSPSINVFGALAGRGGLKYPLIARKSHHQGGKGLWTCLVKSHVDAAISAGADYFQNYINIQSEYRLHVFDGAIIYAVKKVENANETSWIAQRREKVQEYATKNNVNLDVRTLDLVLERLVKEAELPDRIVRSNKRGWKFSSVALGTIPPSLKNAAIKAVSVIGLDFGAVDCAIDISNHPFIIEVNTGPGLQGTSFDKYTEAFRNKLAVIERPSPSRTESTVRPPANNGSRARRAVGAESASSSQVGDSALVHLMNAVQSPEEARRVINLAMGR